MEKIKKIYETDEWLRPYKEAIDARHDRIVATRERFSVDGSLAKGINNHREAERKDSLPMSPALFKTLKQRLSAPKSGIRKSPTDGVTAVRANVRTPLYMSAI